jgi:dihydrofolate reductase
MSTHHPEIIIIAALAESNRAIGKDGKLPWPSIAEDSKRFKELTIGHTVIMGRKTWEYDIERCPLVERCNIVITSTPQNYEVSERCKDFQFGLTFVTSLPEALELTKDAQKAFIVGGAVIYQLALELADTWELTIVEGEYEGDTFFPEYKNLIGPKFTLENVEPHVGFRYETYRKKTRTAKLAGGEVEN